MRPKPCIIPECTATTTNGPRCPPHQRQHDRATRSRTARPHYAGNWQTRSKQAITEWLNKAGPYCPGWGPKQGGHRVPPHTLTADHINPSDPDSPIRILCRSCNSRRQQGGP